MTDATRNRLMGTLSHIGHAIEEAKAHADGGQVLFAVVTRHQDDTGSMTASFEAEQFFKDVCSALGFESPEAMLEHMIASENGKLA